MGVKVFAVRVGNRYGIQYEKYLKSKLPDITFLNEERENFKLQWNKLHFFNLEIDEPICVIDIDIILINDYMKLFEYPIERGEFLSIRSWWEGEQECELNGGFYKFYPKDVHYIYQEFSSNRKHWERYYINKKLKLGPVNGEENFVDHMVKQKLNLKFVPFGWACRMVNEPNKKWIVNINKEYPGNYAYLGGKFNDEIKLLHYTMETARLDKIMELEHKKVL